jgi:hypothetical protein
MTDKRKQISREQAFPQETHDQAFYLWYKMGKPEYSILEKAMKEKDGKSPGIGTLQHWKNLDSWDEHADALDGIADNSMDKEIIKQRAELIRKQADIGKELIDMGMNYLQNEGLDNSADAIRAIGKGAELQEKELGWAAVFAELANATEDDLNRKLKKFMTDDVIEGTTIDAPTDEPENKTESDE